MSDDVYEVHAITYARVDRRSPDNFLGGDPHDVPMPLAYYVWLIVGALLIRWFDEKRRIDQERP